MCAGYQIYFHPPTLARISGNIQPMNLLEEIAINCPYCGESITVLVDGSLEQQQYIEDCQVCCKPMDVQVFISADGSCRVEARSEND